MTSEIPAAQNGEPKSDGDQQKAEVSNPVPETGSGKPAAESPDCCCDRKYKRKHDGFEWASLIINVLLFFSALAAAVAAAWLACLTQDGLKDARWAAQRAHKDNIKSIVTANRAWIAPVFAQIKFPRKEGDVIDAVIRYRDVGHEPALNVTVVTSYSEFTTSFVTVDGNPMIDIDRQQLPPNVFCEQTDTGRTSYVGAIWPSAAQESYGARMGPSRKVGKPYFTRAKSYVLQGCFRYDTTAGRKTSKFCFILTPPKTPPKKVNEGWAFCSGKGQQDAT